MSTDATMRSVDALIDALSEAGMYADPDLIAECVDRQDDITPRLLDVLRNEFDPDYITSLDWHTDDPRWYRAMHAGRLLIHFQEEAALSIILDAWRRDDEFALENFTGHLNAYGPVAVPALVDLLCDESVEGVWNRTAAADELAFIASARPEVEETVLEALRSVLPPLDESDGVVHPAVDPLEVTGDDIILWTFVAFDLAQLQDPASRDRVDALLANDLIDTKMYGGQEAFDAAYRGENRDPALGSIAFDVVAIYETMQQQRRQWERQSRQRQKQEEKRAERQQKKSTPWIGDTYVRPGEKVGRNAPCPCGSGRKYKHCCA